VRLLEPIKKRANFLPERVENSRDFGPGVALRAEDAAADPAYRERSLTAHGRAVAGAADVAELTVPFWPSGGRAFSSAVSLGPLTEANCVAGHRSYMAWLSATEG